jgi:tRNA(Ile)-lysidine synthase
MPSAGETIVAGLSGGADSVALVDALATLGSAQGFRVVAAHLDHGLRDDSCEDASFCAALCAERGVSFRTARADVRGRASRDRTGIEDAGRTERYRFLRAVAREEAAVAIAVAHTRDDQAETLLLRLLRGAGSVGLGAMRPRSGDVVRPLLRVSRQQVIEHLLARGLCWREDVSNFDLGFLRNRIRHELLPYLEARLNPSVRETLARSAALLADEADVLGAESRVLFDRIARHEGGAVSLDRAALRASPRATARLALRQAFAANGGLEGVSAAHVERVLELAASAAPSGRRLPLPGRREVCFSFGEIRVAARALPARPFAYALPVPGRVELPGGLRLLAASADGPAIAGERAAVVSAPETPLMVRTRRPGDRVRAHGRDMSLKRFLMDRKVPAGLRGGLPLVAAGREVVWVPGQPMEPREAARFVRLEMERA